MTTSPPALDPCSAAPHKPRVPLTERDDAHHRRAHLREPLAPRRRSTSASSSRSCRVRRRVHGRAVAPHRQSWSRASTTSEESTIMLAVLGLIDVVMIANLLIMRDHRRLRDVRVAHQPRQPPGSARVAQPRERQRAQGQARDGDRRHLLHPPSKTFIEVGGMSPVGTTTGDDKYTPVGVMWQVIIHVVFILSALALARDRPDVVPRPRRASCTTVTSSRSETKPLPSTLTV